MPKTAYKLKNDALTRYGFVVCLVVHLRVDLGIRVPLAEVGPRHRLYMHSFDELTQLARQLLERRERVKS